MNGQSIACREMRFRSWQMSKQHDKPDQDIEPPPKLEEGRDYYFEGSLMVFTSAFLLKRGFCCESGCRHCPYGYSKEDERLK